MEWRKAMEVLVVEAEPKSWTYRAGLDLRRDSSMNLAISGLDGLHLGADRGFLLIWQSPHCRRPGILTAGGCCERIRRAVARKCSCPDGT